MQVRRYFGQVGTFTNLHLIASGNTTRPYTSVPPSQFPKRCRHDPPYTFTPVSYRCRQTVDVNMPYWLPTTISVTSVIIVSHISNHFPARTITRNLTEELKSLASKLVPDAQSPSMGRYTGPTTVDLVFGTKSTITWMTPPRTM